MRSATGDADVGLYTKNQVNRSRYNSLYFVLKSFALAEDGIVRESHLSLFVQVLRLNNFQYSGLCP